ncbi:MAG: hypothetical protein A2474_08215 [Elusimicrobia bacterium RIFOXYC2_FULL_34_12]|nr:MAG: hypothetical protein A2474_08215 [Elusimicrobia bacterium RIFOXYC2_FULL_34_12]HAM39234.1 hypothetical protein [Elusimicrobiota bacterium]
MVDFSRKMDWQINNNVKVELVKRWINVQKLSISSIKGNVEIKGEIEFTGKLAQDKDRTAILNFLKMTDLALRGISNVRSVKWNITGWQRVGNRWIQTTEGQKKEAQQKETVKEQEHGGE